MGDLIGGIVGGIGSIVGGAEAASAEKAAAKSALTGFNYLNSNPLINQLQGNASSNIPLENSALAGQASTVGNVNQLLNSDQANSPAYQNYLKSTGYNFQMQQGSDAITGNAAAKGLLNSGATGKALTTYGQNLASTTFNNYLGQQTNLANLQGANAAGYSGAVTQGLQAAADTGSAGSIGGGAAATQIAAAGQSTGSALANAANTIGGALGSGISGGGIGNFLTGGGVGAPSSGGFLGSDAASSALGALG